LVCRHQSPEFIAVTGGGRACFGTLLALGGLLWAWCFLLRFFLAIFALFFLGVLLIQFILGVVADFFGIYLRAEIGTFVRARLVVGARLIVGPSCKWVVIAVCAKGISADTGAFILFS
jgi:hypothetical protein